MRHNIISHHQHRNLMGTFFDQLSKPPRNFHKSIKRKSKIISSHSNTHFIYAHRAKQKKREFDQIKNWFIINRCIHLSIYYVFFFVYAGIHKRVATLPEAAIQRYRIVKVFPMLSRINVAQDIKMVVIAFIHMHVSLFKMRRHNTRRPKDKYRFDTCFFGLLHFIMQISLTQ